MQLIQLSEQNLSDLVPLQTAYKAEIGEPAPTPDDFARLGAALRDGLILFFACEEGGRLVGCCSITPGFSTFDYRRSGVFEDFYILPEYRHSGLARRLVRFAFAQSGVSSLTVGCADCDLAMYNALGFRQKIGNLLAYET